MKITFDIRDHDDDEELLVIELYVDGVHQDNHDELILVSSSPEEVMEAVNQALNELYTDLTS